MTQPKPLITFEEKCPNPNCFDGVILCRDKLCPANIENGEYRYSHGHTHRDCGGTGKLQKNVYTLKDFECYTTPRLWESGKEITHKNCGGKKIGGLCYKILFKKYEIKKVSEIDKIFEEVSEDGARWYMAKKEHVLRENDKVVIT